ncbi:MAG: hypothetical protein KME43_18335 [Myxacorys chilensis ATA2-1-KO14]|nr:hypothetical protein [Myxacorys chilensis ATA2-1-KO14]
MKHPDSALFQAWWRGLTWAETNRTPTYGQKSARVDRYLLVSPPSCVERLGLRCGSPPMPTSVSRRLSPIV